MFPDETGFRLSDCGCPDACEMKEYGADLSYATFSTFSVNSLLDEDTSDLKYKYHHALEIKEVGDYSNNYDFIISMKCKM